jgi:hypothetical protein
MIAEELKMFPNDSQGTIFNGHDLTLKSGPLQPTPRPSQRSDAATRRRRAVRGVAGREAVNAKAASVS